MKKATVAFTIGLVMFMGGIYLSTIWELPGMLIGIFGGMMMGRSTYYIVNRKEENQ